LLAKFSHGKERILGDQTEKYIEEWGVGRGRGEGVYNMHKQIKPFAEAQNCIGLQMHLVQEAWQIFAEF
jgi:hypothetical protein